MFVHSVLLHVCSQCFVACLFTVFCCMFVHSVLLHVCSQCFVACLFTVFCCMFVHSVLLHVCSQCFVACLFTVFCCMFVHSVLLHVCSQCFVACLFTVFCSHSIQLLPESFVAVNCRSIGLQQVVFLLQEVIQLLQHSAAFPAKNNFNCFLLLLSVVKVLLSV